MGSGLPRMDEPLTAIVPETAARPVPRVVLVPRDDARGGGDAADHPLADRPPAPPPTPEGLTLPPMLAGGVEAPRQCEGVGKVARASSRLNTATPEVPSRPLAEPEDVCPMGIRLAAPTEECAADRPATSPAPLLEGASEDGAEDLSETPAPPADSESPEPPAAAALTASATETLLGLGGRAPGPPRLQARAPVHLTASATGPPRPSSRR